MQRIALTVYDENTLTFKLALQDRPTANQWKGTAATIFHRQGHPVASFGAEVGKGDEPLGGLGVGVDV